MLYARAVYVRLMRAQELDTTVAVWQTANIARGKAPAGERVARVREKLLDPTSGTYVAVATSGIVGMALVEPGRADDGEGAIVPGMLHVSMVFVSPLSQRRGVGRTLMRHIFETQTAAQMTSVSLWTSASNTPARRLYESVGMSVTRTRRISGADTWVCYGVSPL
jgi:ribosomal protein S18 acetylase RimI-like enzyme